MRGPPPGACSTITRRPGARKRRLSRRVVLSRLPRCVHPPPIPLLKKPVYNNIYIYIYVIIYIYITYTYIYIYIYIYIYVLSIYIYIHITAAKMAPKRAVLGEPKGLYSSNVECLRMLERACIAFGKEASEFVVCPFAEYTLSLSRRSVILEGASAGYILRSCLRTSAEARVET